MASISFTFDATDPRLQTFLDIFMDRSKPGNLPNKEAVNSTNPIPPECWGSPEESDVRGLWQTFQNGHDTKLFLREAALFCQENETDSFTFDDLIPRLRQFKKGTLKALNRNAKKAQKKSGVKVISSKWDYNRGMMRFTMKPPYQVALIDQANNDDELRQ